MAEMFICLNMQFTVNFTTYIAKKKANGDIRKTIST